MLNRDSDYARICLYVLIGFGALILWGMLRGFIRGAYRQLTHTITFLISAALSFVAVKFLIGYLVDWIDAETIGDAFEFIQSTTGADLSSIYQIVLDVDFATLEGVLVLPATVVLAPIVFVLIFFILRIILGIVRLIVAHLLDVRKPQNVLERFGGLCLAAVQTVLFISVLLLPVTSVAIFVDDAYVAIVDDGDEESAKLTEQYYETVMPLSAHPALSIAKRSANSIICASFSSSGDSENAKNDLIYTVKIAAMDLPKLMEIDFNNITDKDKEIIDRTIGDINHSDFIASVMASIISNFSKTFEAETKQTIPAPFDTLFGDLFSIFEDSNKDSIKEDLGLIKDLIIFMSDNHIIKALADGGDLLNVLTSKNPETDVPVINELIDLINGNERTKHLVTSITKLSISMLANTLGSDYNQLTEVYDNIKNDISGILSINESDYGSKEEYLEALSDNLGNALASRGIALDDSIVDSIAGYVDEKGISDPSQLTDDEFNDIILSFYGAQIEQFGNGTIPDSFNGSGGFSGFGDLLGGGTSNNGDAGNNGNAGNNGGTGNGGTGNGGNNYETPSESTDTENKDSGDMGINDIIDGLTDEIPENAVDYIEGLPFFK